jgi:hypothetical protein
MYKVRIFHTTGEINSMFFSDLNVAYAAFDDYKSFFDWALVDTDVIIEKEIINNVTGDVIKAWHRG